MGYLWTRLIFLCSVIFVFGECWVPGGDGGVLTNALNEDIGDVTITLLCRALCVAKCRDRKRGLCAQRKQKVTSLNETSKDFAPRKLQLTEIQDNNDEPDAIPDPCIMNRCTEYENDTWIQQCGVDSECIFTCNNEIIQGPRPSTPYIHGVTQEPSRPYHVSINWTRTDNSACSTLYLIQWKRETDRQWNISAAKYEDGLKAQTEIEIDNICEVYDIRVTTINTYGFSDHSYASTKILAPGEVSEVTARKMVIGRSTYFLPAVVFSKETGYFSTNVSWSTPKGWKSSDIHHYHFHPQAGKACKTLTPPAPITERIVLPDGSEGRTIWIHHTGYTCEYLMQVHAVSRCTDAQDEGIEGEPITLRVDVTGLDCNIPNWDHCPNGTEFKRPGPARNVTVHWEYGSKNITVTWEPPLSRGSTGYLEYYFIQWGTTIYFPKRGDGGLVVPVLKEEGIELLFSTETAVNITIRHFDVEYGIKILPLAVGQKTHPDAVINLTLIDTLFTVGSVRPTGTTLFDKSALTIGEWPSQSPRRIGGSPEQQRTQIAMYIIFPIFAVIFTVTAAIMYLQTRRKSRSSEPWALDRDISLKCIAKRYMVDNPFYESSFEPDKWEVPHDWVVLSDTVLGRGAFGQVVLGQLCMSQSQIYHRLPSSSSASSSSSLCPDDNSTEAVVVAIKTLPGKSEDYQKKEFLEEINLMKTIGQHANVVSMVGCCTIQEPLYLLVEHMPCGDLLHYLRRHRHRLKENCTSDCDNKLTLSDLLSFAKQISVGMEFLSQKGFVHRDLATRNILVGHNKVVKIGDFGLTRYIYDDKVYVTQKGGKLPLKWMAIESIFDLAFSSHSDVWSFGVVIFEILTLGGTPYPTISNHDILKELQKGYRMERPENCSLELYELMCMCWKENPAERPSFTYLRDRLDHMIEATSAVDYLQIDENCDYYRLDNDTGSDQTILLTTTLMEDCVFLDNDQSESADSNPHCNSCAGLQGGPVEGVSILKLSGSSSGVSSMGLSTHSGSQLLPSSSLSSVEDSPGQLHHEQAILAISHPKHSCI